MYFATFTLFVLLNNRVNCVTETAPSKSHEWDILIFSQHWPITVCREWQLKDKKNNCSLPILHDIWTIHGIWPTKLGTDGPSFCNNTWKFDEKQLLPLESQLDIFWLNIEKNTPHLSFWKHEWMKHGTCAAQHKDLNSESKYFKQGLDWIGKYNMNSVLLKSDISPNKMQGYPVEKIHSSIRDVLGKNPSTECVTEKGGINYLSEIRLCFDKQLELIDCDGLKDLGYEYINEKDLVTNCDVNKPVMYPDIVPPAYINNPRPEIPWLNAYRLVTFLMWFTL